MQPQRARTPRPRGIAPAASYLAVALEAESGAMRRPSSECARRRVVSQRRRRARDCASAASRSSFSFPRRAHVDASNAQTAASLLPKSGRAAQAAAAHLRRRRYGRAAAGAAAQRGGRAGGSRDRTARVRRGTRRVVRRAGRVPAALRGRRRRAPARVRLRGRLHRCARTTRNIRPSWSERSSSTSSSDKTSRRRRRRLNVHRHTVFYRLRQIGEICGALAGKPARSTHPSLGGGNR